MEKRLLFQDERGIWEIRFEVPQENFHVPQAIHAAALEYCGSQENWQGCGEKQEFSYRSFFDRVPDDICKKHGFVITGKQEMRGMIGYDTPVLSGEELAGNKACDAEKESVLGVAVSFARMWGIMETLGELPQYTEYMLQRRITQWAEEYMTEEEKDKISFFQKKMQSLKE